MATTIDATGVPKGLSASVRKSASYNAKVIASLNEDESVDLTKVDNQWYYTPDYEGWIYYGDLKITVNKEITTISKETSEYTSRQLEKSVKQQIYEAQLVAIESELYNTSTALDEDEIVDSLIVNNLNGIYGAPYQFMKSVDPRLGSDDTLGRKYAERIISKMPLLCMTPGKPQFMSNFSKGEKKGILAKLLSKTDDADINDIIENNERYFTFAFEYDEYFKYVNGLCQTGARFLNIQNLKVSIGDEKAKLSEFDWSLALNSNLKATFTGQEFIAFYIDSTDSVSESFSNSTTKSQLETAMNGYSDTAREIGFLIGAGAGKEISIMDEAQLSQTMESIDKLTNKYLNGSNLIQNIANNFATVATGAKLLFPEIWSDSEFSKDFDINIKLRTPDADTLSWYLNIYVPLCHLIAFAAGHQTDYVNGYYSPFLVRANYKGLFNVDMGIVTDLSIEKGKEAAWNIDGLPTEINVNMRIKDLYNMLALVSASEPKKFVTNNILMDYVANTCGININQMDLVRSVEIYYILTKNRITNLPNTISRKFQDAVDTYAMNLYDKVLNNFLI